MCDLTNMNYFEMLNTDVDDFINLANYYFLKAKYTTKKSNKPKETRIHVTDETATGGWY